MKKDTPQSMNGNNESENRKTEKRTDTARTTPSLRDDFDRMIDDRPWLDPVEFFRSLPRLPNQIRRSMFPRVDVNETDKEIRIMADVPGVDPDNIDIDIRDNRLYIKGKIERESETEKNTRPYRYERTYGEFQREFSLPAPVDEEKIKATYKNGVLTITVPKIEIVRKNRVKIERG